MLLGDVSLARAGGAGDCHHPSLQPLIWSQVKASQLYSFSVAAVTIYHKPRGLK